LPLEPAPHTAQYFAALLDTYTDTTFAEGIHKLPEDWQDINNKCSIITKIMQKMSDWGEYTDDHNMLEF
jgi:hypothetical protein